MRTWLQGARCTDPEAMPEMEARGPAENRHGGAPRGERPASWDAPRLTERGWSRLANATAEQVRLSALRPPLFWGGRDHKDTTRAQKRAAGRRRAVLCGIVNSRRAPLRGSHPNVSNRRRLPAAAPIHQRARALYFSCYLQVRPAGLHPPRAQGTRATLARDTRPPLGPHASRPRYARSSA